jgi:hypothetical protein
MSGKDVLSAFDSLPRVEQQQVAAEILRRCSEGGDLSDAAFEELADNLFSNFDAEEAARAEP